MSRVSYLPALRVSRARVLFGAIRGINSPLPMKQIIAAYAIKRHITKNVLIDPERLLRLVSAVSNTESIA